MDVVRSLFMCHKLKNEGYGPYSILNNMEMDVRIVLKWSNFHCYEIMFPCALLLIYRDVKSWVLKFLM